MAVDEFGNIIPWTKWSPEHGTPPPEEREKDLDHRRFTFTPLASQIRSAFRKGLWLGEHDDAEADDLMAIYRTLVDVIEKNHPEQVGKMYDKLRPKVEKFYKERNKRYRQTK